jgi:hypothetical protein
LLEGIMSVWANYPQTYRHSEVEHILSAVQAGECVAVIGLSGAGKSNLLGFIAQRLNGPGLPDFVLVDCNRLASPAAPAFMDLIGVSLADANTSARPGLARLQALVASHLERNPAGLCLLIDRFDLLPESELGSLASNLRALRDTFKYSLTYVIASRRPLDPDSELAELVYAHTLWLGPLAPEDARWSAAQFAARRGLEWPQATLDRLVELSQGYPALLRACCEAHAQGAALDLSVLGAHPAVRRRVEEFWRARPAQAQLQQSGLAGHPLLGRQPASVVEDIPIGPADSAQLTALEFSLLAYFRKHPGEVCSKDQLIEAVWPEDVYVGGLRDDSLAQLVRRLRLKIEADPSHPVRILTVPGRGYRFSG